MVLNGKSIKGVGGTHNQDMIHTLAKEHSRWCFTWRNDRNLWIGTVTHIETYTSHVQKLPCVVALEKCCHPVEYKITALTIHQCKTISNNPLVILMFIPLTYLLNWFTCLHSSLHSHYVMVIWILYQLRDFLFSSPHTSHKHLLQYMLFVSWACLQVDGSASWQATKDCGGGVDQNKSLAKIVSQLLHEYVCNMLWWIMSLWIHS